MSDLRVGAKAQFHKTISEYDVYAFAGISGDFNRFHVDEEYARKTFFKHRIVHGVLLLSFVSKVLGTQLPGPGSILTSLLTEFIKPAYFGDTITTEVEVIDIEGNKINTSYHCINQNNEILLKGQARVTVPKT